jgi:hypothetical protein
LKALFNKINALFLHLKLIIIHQIAVEIMKKMTKKEATKKVIK